MPIGKNAIKRVENNGYSKVASSAPDMENSHVIANPDPQVVEKLVAPVAEAAAVKTTKKSPAKKAPAKKSTAKKPCAKKAVNDGFARVELGADMPYYLL
ncbi:MAG: hypothetical protein E7352_03070 [Clostridiales bacterium]|nr:hypothetical protein [Clostridiales bacterium]